MKKAMCKKCTLQIPIIDGNKRSGAFAFIWFLQKAGILNMERLNPNVLTALTFKEVN